LAGHTYALQPLVLRSINANGVTDYFNGLIPDIQISEDFTNPGILGDPNELLLKTAIDHILGNITLKKQQTELEIVGDSKMFYPTYQRMYLDPE